MHRKYRCWAIQIIYKQYYLKFLKYFFGIKVDLWEEPGFNNYFPLLRICKILTLKFLLLFKLSLKTIRSYDRLRSLDKSGLAGLQVATRLPEGTPNKPSYLRLTSVSKRLRLIFREQPRRTAGLLQLEDPCLYYYLPWASPPFCLSGLNL